jgi:magnesium-transporting ATPase (P-type)
MDPTDAPVQAQTPWHAQDAEVVLRAVHSSANGLGAAEAASRLTRNGPNKLPEAPRDSAIKRMARQFHNVLIYVLLGAALLTLLLQHYTDSAVIVAVVLVNALIGYIQEGRAEQALLALRDLLAPKATVLRDGARHTIDAEELVVGDVVQVEAGDKLPADLRLLQVHGLSIQEALLTGESVPVEKQIAAVASDCALGDRSCMAFSGTLVGAGQARGVVVAVAGQTELGKVSKLLASVTSLTTPLVVQMAEFARWLSFFILLVAALLLVYGHFVLHYPFAELLMVVVGLSVAAIPEGLPAVMTITLAVGVQAMARRRAVVRRLPAIETIGAVSVICTDKTGTLTLNEMSVQELVLAEARCQIDGHGYAPHGTWSSSEGTVDRTLLADLALAARLCNDARLIESDGLWRVSGDPMEGALQALSGRIGLADDEAASWARRDAIPFDARHRYMATLHHDHDGHARILLKGAPEQLLAVCTLERTAAGAQPLRAEHWHAEAERMAAAGHRVLALADRPVATDKLALTHADLQQGMRLLGLVGLIDPPRPEAIEAVGECHRAGIEVKMITGDHAGTAMAIARQIGLARTDRVVLGSEIDNLDDAALAMLAAQVDIYARTSPEHKLRLVTALQRRGLTVAMTGDGVNDAPALKRADIGIAMGRGGSEAAKEAAALVLTDDNFASIVAAVREGRTVYDNLKKVISWSLPTSAGEAMTIMVALLLGMTLPVTAVQILWVNLITAVTLGVALAFEPTERNSMRRPPRARAQPLLGAGLIWHIVLVSTLFLFAVFGVFRYGVEQGHSEALARSLAVNTLVVLEIFHLFFIRNIYSSSLSWSNIAGTPVIWATVVAVTVAQFAITYLPWLQTVFGTAAVGFADGVLIVAIGVVFFALLEIEKQLRLRLRGEPASSDPAA